MYNWHDVSWKGLKLVSSSNVVVSVLVPIYNVERYLDQCLSSLVAQSFKNFEVICINDGSKDGSRDIIQRYLDSDERFRVIDKGNSGYGDSMNQGLDAARGKYISILESDDFLDPGALEYMVESAEANSLDFFKCNFWLYWTDPQAEYSYRNDVYFSAIKPEMISLGVHAPRVCPEIFWAKPSIWSAIYRRDFLEGNDIRFLPTPGASYQDSSFTFKVLACSERAMYSGKAFLHYRQDNESSSVNSKGKVFCTCDEHAEMQRFLQEDRPDLAASLNPIRAHVKFLNYMWNYDRLSDNLKDEFLGRFAREMREEIEAGYIPEGVLNGKYLKDPDLAPFQYFSKEQVREVLEVAYNPKLFAARRASLNSPDKVQTLKNYWNAGGVSSVVELVKSKAKGEL